MSRYVRAARVSCAPRANWYDDDNPLVPSINVDDNVNVKTGLLWLDGEPIFRTPNPVGFGRNDEW